MVNLQVNNVPNGVCDYLYGRNVDSIYWQVLCWWECGCLSGRGMVVEMSFHADIDYRRTQEDL